jgi:hypothetical protein
MITRWPSHVVHRHTRMPATQSKSDNEVRLPYESASLLVAAANGLAQAVINAPSKLITFTAGSGI